MWEWPRAIVLPLTMQGYQKAMIRQRDRFASASALSPEDEASWQAAFERGERLLRRYFEWAPSQDAFSPVRVEADFDANVPDPGTAGLDLVGPRGPIHYQGRIDALVVDAFDAYWIMDHRVVEGAWEDADQLLLDERGIAAGWAWEIFYYGMKIAGTIYNELRLDPEGGAPAGPGPAAGGEVGTGAPTLITGRRRMYLEAAHVPEDRMQVTGGESFRRTRITRRRAELDACGFQVAAEALEMTGTDLSLYPNPTEEHCASCAFRQPCLALNCGLDPSAMLAAGYRDRGPEEVEEGRLGGVTWSMNRGARPPKFGG